MARVLFVSKSQRTLGRFILALAREGHVLLHAHCVDSCMLQLTRSVPACIVVDFDMGSEIATQVVDAIRRIGRFECIPVLALSGDLSNHQQDLIRRSGASAVASRRMRADDLSECLEQLFERRLRLA